MFFVGHDYTQLGSQFHVIQHLLHRYRTMVSIPLWILFLVVGPNEAILCFSFKDAQLPQIGSHGNEVKEVSDDWLKKKRVFFSLPSPVTPNHVSLLKGMAFITSTNVCVDQHSYSL